METGTKKAENKNCNIETCGYCGDGFDIQEMKKLSLGSKDKIYFYSCKYCVNILNIKYKQSNCNYERLLIG